MMRGCVFDIREFTLHDGPGIRITVFMKGCPLRCKWCHNPEGLLESPQNNLRTGKLIGKYYTVDELVNRCLPFKEVFDLSDGGVTFSGGEPTFQADFLMNVARKLRKEHVHVNLDTSGFCSHEVFQKVIEEFDLCYYDLKCMDSVLHKEMTGQDNRLILDNLSILSQSLVPFVIRVPSIPGVSDTVENRKLMEEYVGGLVHKPERVDWLPYNELAPAKYEVVGLKCQFQSALEERRGIC